jgi:hypothetical protein
MTVRTSLSICLLCSGIAEATGDDRVLLAFPAAHEQAATEAEPAPRSVGSCDRDTRVADKETKSSLLLASSKYI